MNASVEGQGEPRTATPVRIERDSGTTDHDIVVVVPYLDLVKRYGCVISHGSAAGALLRRRKLLVAEVRAGAAPVSGGNLVSSGCGTSVRIRSAIPDEPLHEYNTAFKLTYHSMKDIDLKTTPIRSYAARSDIFLSKH